MLAQDDGTRIELFSYVTDRPRPPARTCDIGYRHTAVLVDNLPEACRRFTAMGGRLCRAAGSADGRPGEDTGWIYGETPWGSVVEILASPS